MWGNPGKRGAIRGFYFLSLFTVYLFRLCNLGVFIGIIGGTADKRISEGIFDFFF